MSRERPLAPHRLALLGVAVALGAVALLALEGPDWTQRAFRPLAHEGDIASAAEDHELDPYLVAAVINVESGFDSRRVSPRGAVGLMQLMPATAEEVGERSRDPESVTPEKLKEPTLNIELGSAYLSGLIERYDGDVASALAAYNAGPANADRWRVPLEESGESSEGSLVESIGFPETKRYVREVLEQREDYERLYPGAFAEQGPKERRTDDR